MSVQGTILVLDGVSTNRIMLKVQLTAAWYHVVQGEKLAGLGALLSIFQPGLGITVGLGFYLPFNIVLTYSLGTILRITIDAKFGKRFSEETGIPVAAGLIVGEALVGVGFAIYYVVQA